MAMRVAAARQPVGCLKTALRTLRHQKTSLRCLATAAAAAAPVETPKTAPPKTAFSQRQHKEQEKVNKFHLWPQLPSVRTNHPDPMPFLRKQEIARLDPTGARTRLFSREHADSAKVGDVLTVTTSAGEPFSGAFIQIRRRGVDTAILLRGQLMKTGVETWFKIYSPTVTGMDIIWRRPKRARRARLTYMRKPKHDMGSVEALVSAWKKERYALRSKAKAAGGKQQQRK